MIVKTPLKKKKTKPNVRSRKNGSARSKRSGSTNGTRYGRPMNGKKKKSSLGFPKLKPWKVILGAVVGGILGVFYLNHVFATQELLQEVQQLEREYNQVRRMHNDYRLTYDRMIGPAEIYDKAKLMGFINGGPAEKVIEVEAE